MAEDNHPGPEKAEILPTEHLMRALCEEAQNLATKAPGRLIRLSIEAGHCRVELGWQEGQSASVPPASSVAQTIEPVAAPPQPDRYAITAPLVGTFYRAPEPGAQPFVEEGDVVTADQVVCIVEAMKIMNQVQADRSGRVVEILATDGSMVEYNQELILLEPTATDEQPNSP